MITESKAPPMLRRTLKAIAEYINSSYGNNVSATVNDDGDTLIFGDITKSTPTHKIRVAHKPITVYSIEGELGDTEECYTNLDALKNRLVELSTSTMKREKHEAVTNNKNISEGINMNKGTNFAKEFRLYESLFRESTPGNTTTELTEGFLSSVKNVLSKISDKTDEAAIKAITKQVVRNMEAADEPEEADLSGSEDTVVFTASDNGQYLIKKENLALVEKVDALEEAIYSHDDTFAGYEIFTYLLSVLKIPFQYYFED